MAAWFPYDVYVLLASLVFLVWYHFKEAFKKFKKLNIPHLEPIFPLGNIAKSTFRMQHIADDLHDAYLKFPDHKYVGFYQFDKPQIIIRDPEMVKQIMIKDYEYFLNHQVLITETNDALFGRNLFSLKDNKWRNMRSTLSPAFTGSKMKNICAFMSDCGNQVNNYLMKDYNKSLKDTGKTTLTVELKDLCTRFTSDVIATTVFGVTVDSFRDKDNQFYTIGKVSSTFDGVAMLKFFGYLLFPKMMAFFKIKLFSDSISNFYRSLVQDTMKYRENENIHRSDMIQLLMEAKKGTLKYEENANGGTAGFATVEEADVNINSNKTNWSDDDLTAQSLLFFLAGFETAANLMCFILYELTLQPDIQRRLQDEIDAAVEEKGDDVLSYDMLQKLTYLDMVISEALRKWPPAIITDRLCTRNYELAPGKEGYDVVKINPNDVLWFPIYSFHRDPNFWPDPDKFDPERFSEENKKNIRPYTYLPFGAGPRNCIGSRYALMETKVIIYHLLSKFNVKANAKTEVPLKLLLTSFNLKAKNGFWADFEPRNL